MKRRDALVFVEECLQELDSPKCSVATALNKLYRAARLIDDSELKVWCLSYQGDANINRLIKAYAENRYEKHNSKDKKDFDIDVNTVAYRKILEKCEAVGLNDIHLCPYELSLRKNLHYPSSVEFIENMQVDLNLKRVVGFVRYNKIHINNYLGYIKSQIQHKAFELYERLRYSGTISSCFDVLKTSVDDRLLDLNSGLAEQLMTAFKSVNTNDPEQWSHALTSCRRLLEGLADELFPATKELVKGRELKQNQYINRLWAFMDKTIDSESNKNLAKAHVDYLGGWLQRGYQVANKGVHAEIEHLEATKLVFHIYLVIADILNYLEQDFVKMERLDLHYASLDEIEVLSGISRDIAKQIFKLKLNDSPLTDKKILEIDNVDEQVLDKIKEAFNF